MLGRKSYGNSHALSKVHGAGGGAQLGWLTDSDYADAAVVADFNNDRYALPLESTKDMSGAPTFNTNGGTGVANESPAGTYNLTADGTNVSSVDLPYVTVAGRLYRLEFTIAGAGPTLSAGSAAGIPDVLASQSYSVGSYAVYLIANAAAVFIRFRRVTAGAGRVSAVKLTEIQLGEINGTVPKRLARFDEIFAFSAASDVARTYVAQDGSWKNDRAVNQPRFDYRNGKRQLRLEDARTNIINNPAMVGAVVNSGVTSITNWGTDSSGLTATVVGEGTDNGLRCVDIRVQGTLTANFWNLRFQFQSSAYYPVTAGTTLTVSAFVRVVAGVNPGSMGVGIFYRSPAGAYVIGSGSTGSIDSTYKRHVRTHVVPEGNIATADSAISLTSLAGTEVDFTIRVSSPQLEAGAFASDPIAVPIVSAVTRAIETARFSPLVEAIMQRMVGSTIVRGRLDYWNNFSPGSEQRILGGGDVDVSLAVLLRTSTVDANRLLTGNGTSFITHGGSGPTPVTSPFGAGVSFDSSGRAIALNNLVADDTEQIGSRNQVYLARPSSISSNRAFAHGMYDLVAVYPKRVSNARLQALARAA